MTSLPAPRETATRRDDLYRPGPIGRWLNRRFFADIDVDERWIENVRESASRGVVVYVMRSHSFLNWLCLGHLLQRFDLPPCRFVHDRKQPEGLRLAQVVEAGFSALLFLRRPRGIQQRDEEDYLLTLVKSQREMEKPLLILPQTFVWTMRPPRARRSLVDIFFGPVEWPGRLRVFFQFLFNYRNAHLRSGEPFDVSAFLAGHPKLSDEEAADKIRYAMLRKLERERAMVIGPTEKTPARMQDELLRSPRVRKLIESEARATEKSQERVEKRARKILDRLAARPTNWVISILYKILEWVWHRIYDGIVIDKEGLERAREAAREGAVVYLPSHKSHVDYLVLSYVLYGHALTPPLIAAGDNLSFFPLGPVLRRGGAFFIRRSFRGDKLYAGLVDAYMRKLLVEGFGLEFFIEGGRSRTGKLLTPKYGLLSMVVDASLLLRARKVSFMPVSIGYEHVVEERSYVHELGGGEKQKEGVSDLLSASKVLQSRYGRLYVQFGEALSFDELLAESVGEGGGASELTPKQRRQMIQRLAHRVSHQINRVTMVTPAALVATALLAHRRRGMTQAMLFETARSLLETLDRVGAPSAEQLREEDGSLRADTMEEALRLFLDEKKLVRHETPTGAIFTIPEERRPALDIRKNNLIHFFVPYALIAAALAEGDAHEVEATALRERVKALSRLFKYEFMYRADATFDEIFADALDEMVEAKELVREGACIRPSAGSAGRMVPVYASMLRVYFESYLLALRGAALLADGALSKKEWMKRTLSLGHTMYLSGELELRESINKLMLDSALKALKEQKLVKTVKDELEAGDALGTPEGSVALERHLAAHLD